jgi:hypothetical protein
LQKVVDADRQMGSDGMHSAFIGTTTLSPARMAVLPSGDREVILH